MKILPLHANSQQASDVDASFQDHRRPMDVIHHRASRLFLILAGFFVANALVAEFIGVKIFALEKTLGVSPFNFNLFGQSGSLQFSAGVLLWPIVFIMTDIINEYYGRRGVRLLSFLSMGLIAYAFVMIFAAIQLAPADWWIGQNSSKQLVDVFIFHRIKKRTGEKHIWLRATGSTVVSQFFDSMVVLYIAFKLGPELTGTLEPWSWNQLFAVAAVQYSYKLLMAVALTPMIYLSHHFIEKYLGQDLANAMKERAAA
jgi:queuosine precursor transporter